MLGKKTQLQAPDNLPPDYSSAALLNPVTAVQFHDMDALYRRRDDLYSLNWRIVGFSLIPGSSQRWHNLDFERNG